MNKNRTLIYAAGGAVVAALLILLGHLLDLRQPRLALDQQIAYNWLTLLLSPAAFLLRLTRPDEFIVPSVTFAVSAVLLNAMWYLVARKFWLAYRGILQGVPVNIPTGAQLAPVRAGAIRAATSQRGSAAYQKHRAGSSEPLEFEEFAETLSK